MIKSVICEHGKGATFLFCPCATVLQYKTKSSIYFIDEMFFTFQVDDKSTGITAKTNVWPARTSLGVTSHLLALLLPVLKWHTLMVTV